MSNLKIKTKIITFYKGNVIFIFQNVDFDSLRSSLDLLVLHPRSTQIIQKSNPLVDNIFSLMSKYLKDVNVSHLTADKVDPQFSFYTVTRANLQVYRLIWFI